MSDYLVNLIAKSRNLANAVQPRPASPFEPASAGGTPINDPAAADVDSAMEERFPRERSFDRQLTTFTPFERSTDARLPWNSVGSSPGAVQPLPGGSANDDTRQHPAATAGSRSTTPLPSPVIVRDASVVPPPGNGAFAQSRPTDHFEPVLARRTEPLQPTTVISREQPASMIGPAPHDRSASEQDAVPTIRISIGRVDVRAVMPASPAPRPTSSRRTPPLSLNDYLKHQDERKR
jgi:hypothetical protein